MSSSYDSSIFEGGRGSFVLSQRFKSSWDKFYCMLKLAIQMFIANILYLAAHPVSKILFFIYLFVVTFLGYIIVGQILGKNDQGYEDVDLLDVLYARPKALKGLKVKDFLNVTKISMALYVCILMLQSHW